MDKVSNSGFEDSRLGSWLARSAVFLRRGHSTAERRQYGLRWFQPVLFVIVVPLFFCFFSRCFVALFPTATYVNEVNETELTNNQQLIQFKLLLFALLISQFVIILQ